MIFFTSITSYLLIDVCTQKYILVTWYVPGTWDTKMKDDQDVTPALDHLTTHDKEWRQTHKPLAHKVKRAAVER